LQLQSGFCVPALKAWPLLSLLALVGIPLQPEWILLRDQINHGVMHEQLENKKPDGENSSHRQANVSKLGR